MTLNEAMSRLESLGSEKVRTQNAKNGAGDNQFGVKMGDIRNLAKEIKVNPELAKELWKTGNIDAQSLAILLLKPKQLTPNELETMAKDITYDWLAGWFSSYVVKAHPEKEAMRVKWMASDNISLLRIGWSLTTERAEKSPEGLDMPALLDRIEREMGDAPRFLQWTMNSCLAYIGGYHPEYRARAISIAEKLGTFRDYPVSKGCVSPFAPVWIDYIVKLKG